jgi:DNA-binding IclR family transcriptional regulator
MRIAAQTREPAPTENYRVQVLDRAFDLLDALATDLPEYSLGELAHRLSLHKSTAHRLLCALERRRLVERTSSGTQYRLGLRLFELGAKAVAGFGSFETAKPFLSKLAKTTGETAHLGILRDGYVVSVINAESHHALHTPSTIGRRAPAYCTSQGKAMLAFAPPSAISAAIAVGLQALTPRTITTGRGLKDDLKRIRVRGFAVDDEEFETGLRCIAAPVRDHTGNVVAAISIAGPVFRIARQRIAGLAREVRSTADAVSRTLGFPGAKSQAMHG